MGKKKKRKRDFSRHFEWLMKVAKCLAVIWLFYVFSLIFPLRDHGIKPRTIEGIPGIFLAPLLHGDLTHITANTVSFFIFGCILALLEKEIFYKILFFITIVGGLMTWICARPAIHIGASGLIFGMFGYIVLAGYFRQRFLHILASLLVAFFYGGMIMGVLPGSPGVSWESHLFGFIAGVLAARRYAWHVRIRA